MSKLTWFAVGVVGLATAVGTWSNMKLAKKLDEVLASSKKTENKPVSESQYACQLLRSDLQDIVITWQVGEGRIISQLDVGENHLGFEFDIPPKERRKEVAFDLTSKYLKYFTGYIPVYEDEDESSSFEYQLRTTLEHFFDTMVADVEGGVS